MMLPTIKIYNLFVFDSKMPLKITKILRTFLNMFCEFRPSPRNVIPANNEEHVPDKQAGEISELRAQFCPKFSIRTFWMSRNSFQPCQSWHRTWVDGDGGMEPKKRSYTKYDQKTLRWKVIWDKTLYNLLTRFRFQCVMWYRNETDVKVCLKTNFLKLW